MRTLIERHPEIIPLAMVALSLAALCWAAVPVLPILSACYWEKFEWFPAQSIGPLQQALFA